MRVTGRRAAPSGDASVETPAATVPLRSAVQAAGSTGKHRPARLPAPTRGHRIFATTSRAEVSPAQHVRTHIAVATTTDHATVAVSGEVDLSVTPRLRDLLAEELQLEPAALVVDLSDVSFCSAGGLSVLLDAVTTAHARGIPCAIIATHPAVLRPIRLLQLDRVLPVHHDRADAEDWLSLLHRLR
ncbi:STAS domain-containing protein [Amycolatopsis sp. NPDC051102]|uniref:STAS domain-containing protein n=1 Tax=Amycolatopsis sp. NPDC051102 TaxID=3155163 RepID=UPI00343FA358